MLESVIGELVFAQRVTEPHVVWVAVANHHIRFGDSERGGIELLSEAGDLHLRIDIVDPFLNAREHLTGAHRHVVDCDVFLPAHFRAGEEQIGHQINDIAAGEMCSPASSPKDSEKRLTRSSNMYPQSTALILSGPRYPFCDANSLMTR